MRCPNCNNEVPEDKRFCGHCGHRLEPIPAPEAFDDDAPTRLYPSEPAQPLPVEPVGVQPEPPTPTPAPVPPPLAAPPSKRRVSGCTWRLVAALGLVAIVLILGIVLYVTGTISALNQLATIPAPTATQMSRPMPTSGPTPISLPASRPASTPRPTSTPAPAQPTPEPVLVGFFRDIQVPADTPIILSSNWVADTTELVADYLASIELTVALDGTSLPNTEDYWGEIEEIEDTDEDGDPDYLSRWRYPVGVLSEGSHRVEGVWFLQNPITDGWDYDEDGEPDVFEGKLGNRTIEITVGD